MVCCGDRDYIHSREDDEFMDYERQATQFPFIWRSIATFMVSYHIHSDTPTYQANSYGRLEGNQPQTPHIYQQIPLSLLLSARENVWPPGQYLILLTN